MAGEPRRAACRATAVRGSRPPPPATPAAATSPRSARSRRPRPPTAPPPPAARPRSAPAARRRRAARSAPRRPHRTVRAGHRAAPAGWPARTGPTSPRASTCAAYRQVSTSDGSAPTGDRTRRRASAPGSAEATSTLRPPTASRAAVAAARVVLPTPPLPVNSSIRTGRSIRASGLAGQCREGPLQDVQRREGVLRGMGPRGHRHAPSTRRFSSLSAMSMIIFSALRRKRPIIGTASCTARV